MFDYGVVSSYAPSLKVVSHDIAQAIERLGYTAKSFSYQVQWYDARKLFQKAVIFIPFDPLILSPWLNMQRDYVLHGIPAVTYVTVEGKPKQYLMEDWWLRDGIFVANSKFTRDMLKKVGVETINVVYHGIDMQMVKTIKPDKNKLKEELKAKVIFGTVASNLPRKGLDRLALAIATALEKTPDAKFIILTTKSGLAHFRGVKNTRAIPDFGNLDRAEVLSLIGSFDYYICSSTAEGFGLPLLEAQAFGVPCIYPSYAPLTEITHPSANLTVEVTDERFEDQGQGIMYLVHDYSTDELAQRITEAYEIYTCNPEEYQKRSQQVKEHAEQFDIVKTYKAFIR